MLAQAKKCGRGVEPRPQDYVSALPDKFRTDLADASWLSIGDVTEGCAADISARIRELKVVENIEEFAAKLDRHAFLDGEYLRHSEIGVVEARAVEKPPVRRTESSAVRARSEGNWIEIAVGRLK